MGIIGICIKCNKQKEVTTKGKSKGLCNVCYRKSIWKPKLVKCPRCERSKPHHARGLCRGCYSSVFQIHNVKKWNVFLYHNIDYDKYKKLTKECVICGFNKMVDLHHLDHNNKNNSEDNLVGICPNHHKMIHHREHKKEVFKILKEKGFKTPKTHKDDEIYKK